ncbi:hypothetical protein [Rhizobium sp. BK316]|uniref:hypothetical protein n=1 Tax=Rhizobium sp. BK316 TaxID=2587053 RepID=UPI001AEEEE07|nr:hypothetical protein [Rhizobium sp. BK316]
MEIFENFLEALNYGTRRILQTPASFEIEGFKPSNLMEVDHERLLHSCMRLASQTVAQASWPDRSAKRHRALVLALPHPPGAEPKVEDQPCPAR